MDFASEDNEEQAAFRKTAREWMEANIPDGMEHTIDTGDLTLEQYHLRRELGRRLGAQGWLYPTMPKKYGGAELPVEHVVILHEEISKFNLSIPPYYDSGARMGAPTILVWGSEEHKDRFLPPICKGEVRTWQLLTEPGAGSDLAGIKMTAIRDGDHYVLNGQKVFVGSNHGAEFSWTVVVTDPKAKRHENLSWFMIPMDLPGITVNPMDLLTAGGEGGTGSGEKNTIFFDDVRVPAENLVGGENNGWKVATTHLEVEHGGAGRFGDRKIINEFIEFCKERHNGHAVVDSQESREKIVDLYIESQITRLFAMRNYWMAYTDQPRSYEGSQYSLRRKLSGLDISEKMFDIVGPYALIKDEKWAPLQNALELFQREGITALHPGATTDIQRVVMSRRIGIGRREIEKAGKLR